MENDIIDEIELKDLPELYSKLSILILSTLFSPIFGLILYSINLSRLELKNHIIGTVITIFVYSYLINQVMANFTDYNLFLIYPFNLLGGLILIKPFWKSHINGQKYVPKFAWIPIFLIIGFGLFLLGYIYFL